MNILFIDPPFKRFTRLNNPYFPLGLTYLAAVCNKNGHKTSVYEVDAIEKSKTIDVDASHEYQRLELYRKGVNDLCHPIWKEIVDTIIDQDPDVVGITVITTKIASAIRTAELIKKELKDVPIVFGGPHATLFPEQCLTIDSVDYVLRGECENVILQFLSFVEGNIEINGVNNLSYRDKNGKLYHNLMINMIENLDEIPFPDRNSLLFKENYSSEDMGVIMATRGCPYNCTYCAHIFGQKLRKRSVDNVIKEIKEVNKSYGTIQFSFKDDTFTINKEWITELCQSIIDERLNIDWDCTTRANLLEDDLIKFMKNAGCNDIRLGIETGSQRVLTETKKGITFKDIDKAAELLNKNKVLWTGYFMYGLPTETLNDMLSTVQFMEKLNPNYAVLGLYNPFPKTELFDKGVELGLLNKNVNINHFFNTNPKDYYFIDPDKRILGLDREKFLEVEKRMQGIFSKHNKKFNNLLIRAISRKNSYLKNPKLLGRDIIKGFNLLK
jgi:radical SAM superfamily enzyme YgiQ (UPF0313 family)